MAPPARTAVARIDHDVVVEVDDGSCFELFFFVDDFRTVESREPRAENLVKTPRGGVELVRCEQFESVSAVIEREKQGVAIETFEERRVVQLASGRYVSR